MLQLTKRSIPDKQGIYIVSVIGHAYGVLFVIMHDGLQYRFSNYLERKPTFKSYDFKDNVNEWDEFWLIEDETNMGILNSTEEVNRVLGESMTVGYLYNSGMGWNEENGSSGELSPVLDDKILEDAMKWRESQKETVVANPDYADHWHSEDIPTQAGIYLAANLRKNEFQPKMYDGDLTEFIIQIEGEAPFLNINLWEVGTINAYQNVAPAYLRLHINAGYTRIK